MNNKQKDRFSQKTTWITRITLDKPFEVRDDTQLYVLTAPDGYSIKSKMSPDNDHKELYGYAGIVISKEPAFRFVNTRNTELAGLPVRLLKKGTCLEFKSDSAGTGSKNYTVLEKELKSSGYAIISEITERCEKEKCRISTKQIK